MLLGDFVPATWGLEGFVRINSNGGELWQQSHAWTWLWLLTILYTATAYLTVRLQTRR